MAAALTCVGQVPAQTAASAAKVAPPRAHEVELARLRPGKDTLAAAEKLYKREHRSQDSREDAPEWVDGCRRRFLRVELSSQGVIESVTVSALGPGWPDCRENPPDWLRTQQWRTGRGLALGSTRQRVLALYGAPQSRGPSTQQGRELELLFYAFDWAGSDVPQVMEVTLEKGRVVQVTLAFPGL